MTDCIYIRGPVPKHVEADLRRLCALEHMANGDDYGITFARVMAAGIAAIATDVCADTAYNIRTILIDTRRRPG